MTAPTALRGFGIPATGDEGKAAHIAVRVEQLGYHSIWSNDIPGADGIVTAARMAESTSSLRVGVGVVNCDRRAPAEVAQLVRSLGIPVDRLVLGVGAGASTRPLRTALDAMKALRVELGPAVTLALAAMGPQMCRLAGRMADVVLFNWMLPERLEWAAGMVNAGARSASRPGLPYLAAYVRVATGAGAAQRLRDEAQRYHRIPAYRRHFDSMGAPPGSVGIAGALAGLPASMAAYDRVLDEVVVRALPASDSIGSTLAVAEQLAPARWL